jgi:hypothetical protein
MADAPATPEDTATRYRLDLYSPASRRTHHSVLTVLVMGRSAGGVLIPVIARGLSKPGAPALQAHTEFHIACPMQRVQHDMRPCHLWCDGAANR